jgi:D-aminoacyl-tRNA deacylase
MKNRKSSFSMRSVIQRVRNASVAVDGSVVSSIGKGLLCLAGIEKNDSQADIEYISNKILGLRIFDDEKGFMNRSVAELEGEILLISQFTLLGDVRKGRRPSFSDAEAPEKARQMFTDFVNKMSKLLPGKVKTGVFQAMMEVTLINDGPVTILLDSRKLF